MGDGSILKTIIKEGTGEEKPPGGQGQGPLYSHTNIQWRVVRRSRDRNSPFDSGGRALSRLVGAVPTMLLGEIAKFPSLESAGPAALRRK